MAEDQEQILTENLFFLSAALSRMLTKEADDAFATMGLSSSHALLLLLIQNSRKFNQVHWQKKYI